MYQNILPLFLNNPKDIPGTLSEYSLYLPDIIDGGSSNKIDYLLDASVFNQINSLDGFITSHFDINLLDNFYLTKKYEAKYPEIADSSEDLFKKWKNDELRFRNSEINEWLSTYMQIRNSLHYGKE